MKKINDSSEDIMILEFLKGELNSKRFNKKLRSSLKKLNINENLIKNGNTNDDNQNILRKKLMKDFRGYPTEDLFENFPKIYKWVFVKFDNEDIDKIYYINYDYWNELSNGTSKIKEAVKNIENNIEIYDVSNKPFIDGAKNIDKYDFPPVILITCNDEKYLIIEGHSRMTIYGMRPDKFSKTYGYIGYCTESDMLKYDKRMTRKQ